MQPDLLHSPPAVEPLHLDEVKERLRIHDTDQDATLSALIAAAREHVEHHTARALVRQSRRLVLDAFPSIIKLGRSPLRSVESITYVDVDGATQTLASSGYRVDTVSSLPRITPSYGNSWPTTRDVMGAVTVTYSAGWACPFSADSATDTLSSTSHGLEDGDLVHLSSSAGELPGGLSAATPYWVINSTDDTLQMSASNGGSAVDITSSGSGLIFIGRIPRPVLDAMLLIVGHLFENREASSPIQLHEVPLAVDALLSPYRVETF